MMNGRNEVNGLAVELRPVSELKAWPTNARTHSKRQVEAIAESIKAFGFKNPVLIDETDTILAGHGRVLAAKQLGLNQVPVIRHTDLNDVQKRAYVLADNKIAERAGWDCETLATELDELSFLLPEIGLDLSLTGFETGEIDVILDDAEEEKAASRDDEPIAMPSKPISRAGDLWVLGRHRIVCGDALNSDTLDCLLGNELIDMVFCDPPYNVRVRDIVGRGQIKHEEFAMASGEMSADEFLAFLRAALKNAVQVSRDGAMHYVCMDWGHIADLVAAGKPLYGSLKNICVWAKTNGGQGSLYRSAHEMIAVFKVGMAEHVNNVELGRHGRNRTNVWRYAGVNTFKTGSNSELAWHPTVKPVALVADAIKDVTAVGRWYWTCSAAAARP